MCTTNVDLLLTSADDSTWMSCGVQVSNPRVTDFSPIYEPIAYSTTLYNLGVCYGVENVMKEGLCYKIVCLMATQGAKKRSAVERQKRLPPAGGGVAALETLGLDLDVGTTGQYVMDRRSVGRATHPPLLWKYAMR